VTRPSLETSGDTARATLAGERDGAQAATANGTTQEAKETVEIQFIAGTR
jgi:hypothetical protein